MASIIDALYALRKSIQGEDANVINEHIKALETATEPLAHEIMNASVAESLTGKTVEQASA